MFGDLGQYGQAYSQKYWRFLKFGSLAPNQDWRNLNWAALCSQHFKYGSKISHVTLCHIHVHALAVAAPPPTHCCNANQAARWARVHIRVGKFNHIAMVMDKPCWAAAKGGVLHR